MGSWDTIQGLVSKAREGDREAFSALVAEFAHFVESFISSQVGTWMRRKVGVEDLVQETFLRAFLAIGQFRGQTEGTFRSWLLAIAQHAVGDQARRLRTQKAGRHREVRLDQGSGQNGGKSGDLAFLLKAKDTTASKHLGRCERFDRLEQAMRLLTPDHRKVIFLARVRGLPIRETAAQMGRSPEATSMLLLRALLKLKTAFGGTESLHLPHDRTLEDKEERHD